MGTARMGRDPKTSVLNAHNQAWDVKNLFVTDGACMTSSANQNPSITYMALTARAADYAVASMNRGEALMGSRRDAVRALSLGRPGGRVPAWARSRAAPTG